jgi:hypothetical protein
MKLWAKTRTILPAEAGGPFIRAIESLPERFMLLRREDSK